MNNKKKRKARIKIHPARVRKFAEKNPAWCFLLPSLIGVSVFFIIPYADVLRRAFFSAAGGEFRGLSNFKEVLSNQAFRLAVCNTGLFICSAAAFFVFGDSSLDIQAQSCRQFFENGIFDSYGYTCSRSGFTMADLI